MENGMKADVLEISGLFDFAQIAPVTFAQAKDGAARTKHLLPEMRKGSRRSIRISCDDLCAGSGLPVACRGAQKKRNG